MTVLVRHCFLLKMVARVQVHTGPLAHTVEACYCKAVLSIHTAEQVTSLTAEAL
jgi:hypothetical protein